MLASFSASLVAEILADLRPALLGAFGRFRLVSASLVPVEARGTVLANLGSTEIGFKAAQAAKQRQAAKREPSATNLGSRLVAVARNVGRRRRS